MSDETQPGVWIIFLWDYGVHVKAIYATEIEALREVNGDVGYQAAFVPFGADIREAVQ